MFHLSVVPSNLFVRCLTKKDISAYYDLVRANSDNVGAFVQLGAVDSHSSIDKTIRDYEEIYISKMGLFLGVFCEKQLCGEIRCDLVKPSEGRNSSCSCDIAYWLDVKWRGIGVIYKCLRSLLPVLSKMNWVNGSRISRFTAAIERTNLASRSIVERLGFKKSDSSRSAQEDVLDLLAPRSIHEWTLDCSLTDMSEILENAEAEYISNRGNKKHVSILPCLPNKDRVSFLGSLDGFLLSSAKEGPDFTSYASLAELHNVARDLLSAVAPERVMSSERISAVCPVTLEEFRGIWCEAQSCDSLIIVFEEFCIKGFKQFHDGIRICDLVISHISDLSMVLTDGDSTQTWTRISVGVDGLIDGVWKCSRGYIGICGKQYVSSSNLWKICMDPGDGKWSLAIGDQWSFSLETYLLEEVTWSTQIDSTILKRSARKRGNTGPLRWRRDTETLPNLNTLSFVQSVTYSLRNRQIITCMDILKLEIEIILKVSDPGRKIRKRLNVFANSARPVDESLRLRERMLHDSEVQSSILRYWESIRSEITILPFDQLDDHIIALIDLELDANN